MDDVDNFSLRARGYTESEEEASEEEEEVDSYGSPFRTADSEDSEEATHDILWMPEGDMERAYRIAYAFIGEDGLVHSPAPFIHSAIFSVAPRVHYRMAPSSRGQMLLHFDTKAERDYVVDACPITYEGASLMLERSEESSNRFTTDQTWLIAIKATNFPDKHWTVSGIPAAFAKVGAVVEVGWACLLGDTSLVHVVVARETPSDIPDDQFVGNPGKGASGRVLGSTFHIEVLRVWPRSE